MQAAARFPCTYTCQIKRLETGTRRMQRPVMEDRWPNEVREQQPLTTLFGLAGNPQGIASSARSRGDLLHHTLGYIARIHANHRHTAVMNGEHDVHGLGVRFIKIIPQDMHDPLLCCVVVVVQNHFIHRRTTRSCALFQRTRTIAAWTLFTHRSESLATKGMNCRGREQQPPCNHQRTTNRRNGAQPTWSREYEQVQREREDGHSRHQ